MKSLEKISEGVYQAKGEYCIINEESIDFIRKNCYYTSKKRSRINLHQSKDDYVNEMVIALHRDTKIAVHRHNDKTESFNVLDGTVGIILFESESAVIKKTIILDSSTHNRVYRLNKSLYHLVVPITQVVIIHEITQGPFESCNKIDSPDWFNTKEGASVVESMRLKLRKEYEAHSSET